MIPHQTVMNVGASLTGSLATLASAEYQDQLQEAVSTRILADTLALQKTMAAELLQALGLGQNVDLEI